METLLQDTRFALRTLVRHPGLAAVAVLSLALGIGANATVFSMVDAFLLRPLPYEEPERLVHVWSETRQGLRRVSIPDFLDWRRQSDTFADLAAFNYTIETSTGGEFPEQLSGARVSANLFDLLGEEPLLGRAFAEGEDRLGADPVALVSERFWTERYSRDPAVLGATLEIDGTRYTVVGVVREGFNFPLPITSVWLPRVLDDPAYDRGVHLAQVVGRLAPGATRAQAEQELDALAAQIAERYPDTNAEYAAVTLEDLRSALNFAEEVLAPASALMMVSVTFVLLIACANVASLLLSRATARERELAVRTALGAGRGRLIRQMLTESLVLAAGGAAAGVALAAWTSRLLSAAIPDDLYRVGTIGLEPGVLAYVTILAVVTALMFGVIPALRASRSGLAGALRQGTVAAGVGRRAVTAQSVFVAVEMTLSIVLLVGTALMLRTLLNLQAVDPGFQSQGVLTQRLLLPEERYGDVATRDRFHRELVARVESLPGVRLAATVDFLPLNHETSVREFQIDGRAAGEPPPSAAALVVSPDYFEVMGIPRLEGALLSEQDGPETPLRAVVDATMAARYWPKGDPVGSRVRLTGQERVVEVVGVVAATRQIDLAAVPEPMLYLSQRQLPGRYLRILARTEGDPGALAAPVRGVISELDPLLATSEVRTLDTVVSDFLLTQSLLVDSLALLAGGALLLAAIGVYGLMSFFVSQRIRDFGIHRALGATAGSVRRMVATRILKLSAFGVGVGLFAAWGLGRAMASLLYGVEGSDPVTLVGTSLALVAVALAAGMVGARRATAVDPVRALRSD